MAHSIDELIELAASGDEEAAQELKNRYVAKEREAATAARNLKLKTDPTLKERYPRALRAFEKGHLKITEDMGDDALAEALQAEETKLAELGVPVEPFAPQAAATTPAGDDGAEAPTDGARALAGGKAASSPGGQPRDLVAEYFDALKGSTIHDRAKANTILVELNRTPQGKEKVKEITRSLEARPITLSSI